MTQLTAPSVYSIALNRAAIVEELRCLLPRMEGLRTAKTFPFGLAAIDSHLPQGGLACGALHEVVPETEGAIPAALGFIAAILARLSLRMTQYQLTPPPLRGRSTARSAVGRGVIADASQGTPLPILPPQGERKQIARRLQLPLIVFVVPGYGLRPCGRLYGHGLSALGLDPGRLVLVETAQRRDALWAIEEALHSRAPAAVAGMIDKLDLRMSQRLQLAAADAGLPLFLLRPAQMLESSAAATRWRVDPAPAARDRFGLFARARWHLMLERCRNGRAGEWMVEYDHVAHRFSLAAALADPAHSRDAGGRILRQARQS